MATLEDKFEKACAENKIPGVVLMAANVDGLSHPSIPTCLTQHPTNSTPGSFLYAKAFGEKAPNEPMTLDATFVMASCTKLLTTIAALQCVEKGLIGLDDDVSGVLTEFKDIEVLCGFVGEKPILKKAEKKVTLR